MSTTDNPDDPGLRQIGADGMQATYLVLSEAERAQGFVRPLRRSYTHVGVHGPVYPLRDLTPDEQARYDGAGYVAFIGSMGSNGRSCAHPLGRCVVCGGVIVRAAVVDVPEVGKRPSLVFQFVRADGTFLRPVVLVNDDDQMAKVRPLIFQALAAARAAAKEVTP